MSSPTTEPRTQQRASVQVSKKIIDFHLVEKCRTKFRAFVKSYGAKVKFEPVRGVPRKQEYHGTVTVNRACKQQWLTQNDRSVRAVVSSPANPGRRHSIAHSERQLQCAAPVPITTGARTLFAPSLREPSRSLRSVMLVRALRAQPCLESAAALSTQKAGACTSVSKMGRTRPALSTFSVAGAHHVPYFEDGNDALSRSLLHHSLSIPNDSSFGYQSCRVSSGSGAHPHALQACSSCTV